MTTAAWTTLMTGCSPARHGVFDHRYYDVAAGQMKVNHAARVRVPTFWHLLSQAGRSVVSLNVPVTYPPLAVRGVVVSGMDAPHLDAAVPLPRAGGEVGLPETRFTRFAASIAHAIDAGPRTENRIAPIAD